MAAINPDDRIEQILYPELRHIAARRALAVIGQHRDAEPGSGKLAQRCLDIALRHHIALCHLLRKALDLGPVFLVAVQIDHTCRQHGLPCFANFGERLSGKHPERVDNTGFVINPDRRQQVGACQVDNSTFRLA